jgi:hypothetical protein
MKISDWFPFQSSFLPLWSLFSPLAPITYLSSIVPSYANKPFTQEKECLLTLFYRGKTSRPIKDPNDWRVWFLLYLSQRVTVHWCN